MTYSLIINNETCGFFKPTQGLHQSDPLSPYLFILYMDILAQKLHLEATHPKSGLRTKIASPAERLRCLFFANDSLLFCKTYSHVAFKLKGILDDFCQQFGQLVNFHKSNLVFSKNTANLDKIHIAGIFNIPHSSSLGKYHGCTVFQGRPRLGTLKGLLSRAEAQLSNWKATALSKAGRTVLI